MLHNENRVEEKISNRIEVHDFFIRLRRIESRLLALLIAALIHCAVWVAVSPRQLNARVQHEHAVHEPVSVVVYLQPEPIQFRPMPGSKAPRLEASRTKSRLSSERKPKHHDAKQDTDRNDIYLGQLDVVAPNGASESNTNTVDETPPRLDMDKIKDFARQDIVQQGRVGSGQHMKSSELSNLNNDVGGKAIERARRPKCDDDYKPKVGSVEFSGLMKLPFLLKGAVSDSGCKW